MSYVVQWANGEGSIISASLLSRLQWFSQQSSAQPAQKITLLTSISVAASDGESHASADWKTSDLHIDFTSKVSTICLILNSEVALLLLEWQWVISEKVLPSPISVNIFMHQLKMIHCENTVTNQSSAVHTKQLIAVQFSLQWFNQFSSSKWQ